MMEDKVHIKEMLDKSLKFLTSNKKICAYIYYKLIKIDKRKQKKGKKTHYLYPSFLSIISQNKAFNVRQAIVPSSAPFFFMFRDQIKKKKLKPVKNLEHLQFASTFLILIL